MTYYLDPKADSVFKKIFGNNRHLLISLLNALLHFQDGSEIVDIEYLTPELTPTIPGLKAPIVDVRCKDTHGRYFIVEMQLDWTEGILQRVLYNTANMYVKQLPRAGRYVSLQPVYGLSIVNYTVFKESKNYYHSFEMVNPDKRSEKISGLAVILLELNKFKPKRIADKKMTVLWLRFLKAIDIRAEQAEISPDLFEEPLVAEALEMCKESAFSREELDLYEKELDNLRVLNGMIMGSREKGLAEGKAEGRAEGLAEGKAEGRAEGEAIGLEKGRAEGEVLGLEKGRAEGKAEAASSYIVKLSQSGQSPEWIAKTLDISVEDVRMIISKEQHI